MEKQVRLGPCIFHILWKNDCPPCVAIFASCPTNENRHKTCHLRLPVAAKQIIHIRDHPFMISDFLGTFLPPPCHTHIQIFNKTYLSVKDIKLKYQNFLKNFFKNHVS